MAQTLTIQNLLQAIAHYTVQVDPDLLTDLQPGYSAEQIAEIIPFRLPAEILELYAWHNGTDIISHKNLFYYHHFLSVEDAYQIYQDLMQTNREIEFEAYEPFLFPLFDFEGEYYMVQMDENRDDYGSIWFCFHSSGQVYDSLSTMLAAIEECYAVGAYFIQEDEYIPDQPKVAAIKAKWNRCRWNSDGTTLSYRT
ncbi:MAG: SMI1/KNR4 family protein [Chloroflexi bacterium]|nr:SMI1/KNR4 family protein [Chloroflexota bacterium]